MRSVRIQKQAAAVVILAIAVFACFFVVSYADTGSDGRDQLKVGVPADRCPVFYNDPETGEIVGIGVDLMRVAAEEAGYEPTFLAIEEVNLKDALDNTEYDIIMPFGSAVPSTSGKTTIVTENLCQTPFTLVTDDKGKMPPLNELKVGMLKSLGAGAETVKQLFPGIEIVEYETMDESVKALRAGEVDALLHNSYVWSYVLQKPAYSDLTVQPSSMFSMDFRAGTLDSPEGAATVERLNKGIDKITDTQRQAIALSYTSRQLYQKTYTDFLDEYGVVLLLGMLLLIALVVITVMKLSAISREHEAKLKELMDHDLLTGAFNLHGFRKKAEELLRAHPDTPYYLSYNNIRDFRYINESLGREAGDELLKFWVKVSDEFMSDDEVMGRIEGDHFAVLRYIEGEEKMLADEKNIIEPVNNFFINQGKDYRVQVCTGIYVVTHQDYNNIDVDRMLDLARVAERRVRESRSADFAFYNQDQWEKGRLIADVVNFLPGALSSGDLQIWYQPQVNYDTGEMIGAEALCRWDHDKLGWIYPPDFIEILEESGLIYDLDCYVWEHVCEDLKRWNEMGVQQSVSVNVSRCDFQEGRDIPGQFRDLVKKYGLTPDQIRIEITETAYAENPELLIGTTQKLREYGFSVEMDDFGSGYSSLHMLKEVPVDRIKLDLHFLTESGDQEKGRIIISHIIQMVYSLGMNLIAEGVETVQQADFILSRGCTEMQGYYFYKPMPVKDFERKIMRENKKEKE